MVLLEIKKISKQYENHLALNDISLKIPLGKTFALLGHNGAGKSTFIRVLLQIISKSSGQILLDGKEINEKDIRRFGYLPEERGLYKGMKVLEQLIYFGRLKGLSKSEAQNNANEWLTKLSLSDWSNQLVGDLSKGMQQKIQFITAIIHDPEIIVLDEPFSGFDPVNAQVLIDTILELKNRNKTIIFSSHQMSAVEDLCDEIAILNNSKIVLQGSLDALRNQYATNNYLVEGKGSLNSTKQYKVNQVSKSSWVIEPLTNIKDIISSINDQIEVNSFQKEEPSLTEIFINSFNLV